MKIKAKISRADQAEQRRCALLHISLRLFSEKGFHATSIRDIAKAAGITEGLIYHYFRSKKDLLKAIVEESSADPEGFQDLNALELRPVDQALWEIGVHVLKTLRKRKEIFKLMLAEAGLFERNGDHFFPKLIYENRMIRVGDFLKKRMERGEIRRMEPVLLARQFTGSLVAFFIFQEILQGEKITPVESGDFLKGLVEVFMKGVKRA
jgi:AcrR family transcriptional regulator